MGRTASSEDWQLDAMSSQSHHMRRCKCFAILRQSHLTYALEYGALLMDVNIDRLALRCFNTASCPKQICRCGLAYGAHNMCEVRGV